MPQDQKPAHAWEHIAQQITQEQDPARVTEFLEKLNEAMLAEEGERVQRRLGIATADSKQPAA